MCVCAPGKPIWHRLPECLAEEPLLSAARFLLVLQSGVLSLAPCSMQAAQREWVKESDAKVQQLEAQLQQLQQQALPAQQAQQAQLDEQRELAAQRLQGMQQLQAKLDDIINGLGSVQLALRVAEEEKQVCLLLLELHCVQS